MDEEVQRGFSWFRLSLRSLLLGILICSVLLSLLAFHLHRLQRQATAAEYFRQNNSTPITGSVDFNSFTFGGSGTTGGTDTPESGSISVLLPVVQPEKNSTVFGSLVGDWFVRRVRILRIGVGVDFNDNELKANIEKMPWLEQIIVDRKSQPAVNGNAASYDFDSSLSDVQIESLRSSFADLEITITAWVNP